VEGLPGPSRYCNQFDQLVPSNVTPCPYCHTAWPHEPVGFIVSSQVASLVAGRSDVFSKVSEPCEDSCDILVGILR
jgi:hypothetical protein